MDADGFNDLSAYRLGRIQRRHRVLKHHGNICTAQFTVLGICEANRIAAVDDDFAPRYFSDVWEQTHDGFAEHTFAASGLSDNGKNLSPVYTQGEIAQGTYSASIGIENNREVLYFKYLVAQ